MSRGSVSIFFVNYILYNKDLNYLINLDMHKENKDAAFKIHKALKSITDLNPTLPKDKLSFFTVFKMLNSGMVKLPLFDTYESKYVNILDTPAHRILDSFGVLNRETVHKTYVVYEDKYDEYIFNYNITGEKTIDRKELNGIKLIDINEYHALIEELNDSNDIVDIYISTPKHIPKIPVDMRFKIYLPSMFLNEVNKKEVDELKGEHLIEGYIAPF